MNQFLPEPKLSISLHIRLDLNILNKSKILSTMAEILWKSARLQTFRYRCYINRFVCVEVFQLSLSRFHIIEMPTNEFLNVSKIICKFMSKRCEQAVLT